MTNRKRLVRPRWTAEEKATLKSMYRTASNKEIAKVLCRQVSSIVFKAFRLNLHKGPRRLREMGKTNIAKRWTKKQSRTKR